MNLEKNNGRSGSSQSNKAGGNKLNVSNQRMLQTSQNFHSDDKLPGITESARKKSRLDDSLSRSRSPATMMKSSSMQNILKKTP